MKKYKQLMVVVVPITLGVSYLQAESPAPEKGEEYRTEEYGAGTYLDDASITTKVKMALVNEAGLKSAKIDVETTNGVVQLTGKVDAESDKQKAISVARNIRGVQAVKDNIVVK